MGGRTTTRDLIPLGNNSFGDCRSKRECVEVRRTGASARRAVHLRRVCGRVDPGVARLAALAHRISDVGWAAMWWQPQRPHLTLHAAIKPLRQNRPDFPGRQCSVRVYQGSMGGGVWRRWREWLEVGVRVRPVLCLLHSPRQRPTSRTRSAHASTQARWSLRDSTIRSVSHSGMFCCLKCVSISAASVRPTCATDGAGTQARLARLEMFVSTDHVELANRRLGHLS